MSHTSPIRIDLVSDTATRPTSQMRRAMADAPVGDEQRGEDPTVSALCERAAALLGQEAALFLPSGTMCNQIAMAVHCRAGDEVIAADGSHIVEFEGAGAAVFAGSFVRTVPAIRGIFTTDRLIAAIRGKGRKHPRTRLVSLEQTHNLGGGSVWPKADIDAVVSTARENGLKLHMDGARLLNASIAAGLQPKDFSGSFDSVWLDLSKGLGCPVGGVLAGSHAFIAEADIWKHRLGGAMRQAGIIAAAGLYALDHHVERLAKDHENAKELAAELAKLPGIELDADLIETNIIYFNIGQTGLYADEIEQRLLAKGVRIGATGKDMMRAVTHLDVSREDCLEAAEIFSSILT